MAEFAPNLDDGELWLPSEIIADVGLRRFHHSAAAQGLRRRHASRIDGLASQLAALGPLDRVHLLKLPPVPPPRPEGFKPVGPVARFEPAMMEARIGLLSEGRTRAAPGMRGGWFGAGSRPEMTRFGPLDYVVAQLEVFGRVPQRPPLTNRFGFGPVRPGGLGRECGGTGVFLPRVISNHEVKKNQQVEQQRQLQRATRDTAMWKKGRPLQPSSEMGLPQEWTY